MSKKLYIGNLPYSVTETALREMFTPLGVVDSVSIITDRDTGRPKGFAFVEMTDDAAAKQAISQINGKTLDNRSITVAEARPQVQRSGGFGGSRGGEWRPAAFVGADSRVALETPVSQVARLSGCDLPATGRRK